MRELETALINMEEFSDCPFFKFVFMLEVGEPEAVIGSYDDMVTYFIAYSDGLYFKNLSHKFWYR